MKQLSTVSNSPQADQSLFISGSVSTIQNSLADATIHQLRQQNYVKGQWAKNRLPFAVRDPSKKIITSLVKENETDSFGVTKLKSVYTVEEWSKKESQSDSGAKSLRTDKNGILTWHDTQESRIQTFYQGTAALQTLSTAWQIVGRCNEDTIDEFHVHKILRMAQDHPDKKPLIIEAEYHIRQAWIDAHATGLSWTDAILDVARNKNHIWENMVYNKKPTKIVSSAKGGKSRSKGKPSPSPSPPAQKRQKGNSSSSVNLDWTGKDDQGRLVQRCYSFNTSKGCSSGSSCTRLHSCPLRGCNKNHSFESAHPGKNLTHPSSK